MEQANGRECFITVVVKDDAGQGVHTQGAITLTGASAPPSSPGRLQANVVYLNDEGAGVLYYTLHIKKTSEGDDAWVERTEIIDRSLPAQRVRFTGPTSGVEHTFQIRAHNANGHGPWSEAKRTTI